jgi:acyl dehydratase
LPIEPGAVGAESKPFERSWDSTTCLLYALGVGAGVDELAFTTENSHGIEQQTLPTMAIVLTGGSGSVLEHLGPFDWAGLVHGSQAVELHRPLPVEGRLRAVSRLTGIYDKGTAAVVVIDTDADDADTGESLFTTTSSLFIRGEGGWGGDRGPSAPRSPAPERDADHTIRYRVSRDQALLYRLSGDRNPLHSDPAFAQRAGFEQPILHGLCTYGFTGRALLHTVCDGDPAGFRRMEGRFSAPVYPGDELTVRIWTHGDEATFQTTRPGDQVVIDGGRFQITTS